MKKRKRQRKKKSPVLQVEPVFLRGEALIERLASFRDVTRDMAEKVVEAIEGMGMRVVVMCNLCAQPWPDGSGIPGCPNVATVTMRMTKGRTMLGGDFHQCLPHSIGEKVYASKEDSRRR